MTYEASTFMYAMAVSIFAIGGMCGGFIGGWIANKFGRKGGLLVNNLVGIIAALAMAFSKHVTSYELLILGRFLIGVNCGKWILMRFPPARINIHWNKNKIICFHPPTNPNQVTILIHKLIRMIKIV